jgi:excisionase family DNA binding protein
VTDAEEQSDLLLSTGEVARLLGSSRQHVVDLCERGTLPCASIGTHRRIRASDVMAFQQAGERERPRKDMQRSLWLHTAIAGKVLANPDRLMKLAHRDLDKLLAGRPQAEAARQLRRWKRLLSGGETRFRRTGVVHCIAEPDDERSEVPVFSRAHCQPMVNCRQPPGR